MIFEVLKYLEILCKFSYPTFQSIFFRNATHIFKIVISSLPSWRKLFSHFTSCATTLVVVSDNSSIGVLVRTLDAEERIKSSIFRLHPFTFVLFVPVDWIALLSPTIEKSILFWVCCPAPPPSLSLSPFILSFIFTNAKSVVAFSHVLLLRCLRQRQQQQRVPGDASFMLLFAIQESWITLVSSQLFRIPRHTQLSWELLYNFHDYREIIFS